MTSGPQPLTTAQAIALASHHERAGKLDSAAAIYHRVLQAEPANHVALHGLGLVAYRREDYRSAAEWINRAITVNPSESNYHNTLGACQRAMGRPQDAISSYRKALALRPDNAEAHANMGNALKDLGSYDEAIASYGRAAAIKPTHAIHLGLGNTLLEAGRPGQALAHYRGAIALRPEHAGTHFAYSLALLMHGDLLEGWREYEWRNESHARPKGAYRDFSQPKWDGAALEGRRILLYAEQGFGDALQFIRYAPLVARRGGCVMVECRPELKRLFSRISGIERVVARGESLPEFDVRYALLSLPLVFQTTLDSIPAQVPYIEADRDAAAAWRKRLAEDAGTKVGIAWSGSATGPLNRRKACPLGEFAPLARIPGIRCYSLQKAPAPANDSAAGVPLTDWTGEFRDFADTAALLENLTLVISVDTAIAHLAGAMGKPVWLLLNSEGDWRWLLDRDDSPWYPTLRIFRQRRRGDWAEVLERVTAALRAFARIGPGS